MKDIAQIAYEKYQLDWMRRNNCSLEDLINHLDSIWNVWNEEFSYDPENLSPGGTFATFEEDYGFNGALYVCFDEFINAEYTESDYMESLLNEQEFSLYQEDIAKRKTEEDLDLEERGQ